MALLTDISDATRDLLEHAQDEARTLGNGYIGTEHMLIAALVAGGPGVPERIGSCGVTAERVRAEVKRLASENGWTTYVPPETALKDVGVDLEAVRREAEAEFGEGSLPMRVGAPPFTARSMRIIERAVISAREHGRDRAEPNDVLVALLGDGESVATRVLRGFSVDVAALLEGTDAK